MALQHGAAALGGNVLECFEEGTEQRGQNQRDCCGVLQRLLEVISKNLTQSRPDLRRRGKQRRKAHPKCLILSDLAVWRDSYLLLF
jgi:hypothetical protein